MAENPPQNPKKEIPNYARPNIASRLPEYTNTVSEAIRAAFVPNSYTTLNQIGKGNEARLDMAGFVAGHSGHTTFSDFVYTCSPYDLNDEEKSRARKDHEEKMREVAGDQPFFAGYSNYKAKFESWGIPHESDPYDLAEIKAREERWKNEDKALSKPFLPPGVEKALAKPTRSMLGDVMTALFRTISEDWPEAHPTILSTNDDIIMIYFPIDRIKSENGVKTYMNNALRRNDAVLEFDLRKVPEVWNKPSEDNHLMFALRPPWVRPRSFLSSPQQTTQQSQ